MTIPIGPNGAVSKTLTRDTTIAYDYYPAVSVGGCDGCHTTRVISGVFAGKPLAVAIILKDGWKRQTDD
jgi:hypothetical protein